MQIVRSGKFLSRLLGPLLKAPLALMKIILTPLAKSVLITLELIAATSAKDVAI